MRALELHEIARKLATGKAATKHVPGKEAEAVGTDNINRELLIILEKQYGEADTLEDINSLLDCVSNLRDWEPLAKGEELSELAAFQAALTAHLYKLAEENILPTLQSNLQNIMDNGLCELDASEQENVQKMHGIVTNPEYDIHEKLGELQDMFASPEVEDEIKGEENPQDMFASPEVEIGENPLEPQLAEPSKRTDKEPGYFKQLYLSIIYTLKMWFSLAKSSENWALHKEVQEGYAESEREAGKNDNVHRP